MTKRAVYFLSIAAAALASGACEATKSSNPLSPSVAGPIPGVEITAPKALEPTNGTKIPVDKQPITLLIENASSNGVRPLAYVFEVATDANFTNKVFTRDQIAPGEGGRTSLRLPDALATGRTYYWRARAEDGANTGLNASATTFDVFTPIVIQAPGLISPATNATVSGLRPEFRISNAPRSGPVGAISYLIEISDSFTFANKIAAWTAAEGSGQTVLTLTTDLAYNKVYYWHVRAFDPTTSGPFSDVGAFQTPMEPPPVPTVPTPSPNAPAANDAFNLGSAIVHSSPPGVASWPVTTAISSISFRADGVSVEFSKKNGPGRWPDVVPPGWDGPLQYTLWIAMNINGQWHTCGPIEYWYGLGASGGDVTRNNQIAANWTYYCGAMARQPAPGEQVGFFVTAGDQRLKDVAITHERSNVVVVPFPAFAGQTFTF
jgi:hypothetical protein